MSWNDTSIFFLQYRGIIACIKAENVLCRFQSTQDTDRWTHIKFETRKKIKEGNMHVLHWQIPNQSMHQLGRVLHTKDIVIENVTFIK